MHFKNKFILSIIHIIKKYGDILLPIVVGLIAVKILIMLGIFD